MPSYEGRLELTWTNKGLRLLAHEDGAYEWVPRADYRVAEVRLLHEVTTVGEVRGSRSADNLLIRGDSLHGLRSLAALPEYAREYLGKVNLAYLDPPFNTQHSFLQYDDALEHSVWLTMMRDRLQQIWPLLSPKGSLWVHCDDSEQHRLRSVLDEVCGFDRFVATVIWQKRYSRENRPAIGPVHDFIHVYAPAGGDWKNFRNRIPRVSASQYRNPNNDPRGLWRPIPMTAQGYRANQMYEITTPAGAKHKPSKGRCWSMIRESYEALLAQGRIYFGQDNAGQPNIIRYLDEDEGLVPWTWWPHDEVGHTDEAKKEILELFPHANPFETPKPERLMERIIHIGSNPGEIVLDPFVGSGTSAAVAHKMGRRWVAIEREQSTIETYALPRLRKVVAGEDDGGITLIQTPTGEGLPEDVKSGEARNAARVLDGFRKDGAFDSMEGVSDQVIEDVARALRAAEKTASERIWGCGGGFRILDVAPSMFEADGGLVVLAEWMTNGKLAEATAAQLGYDYAEEPPFAGRKGRTRLAVVDGVVNESVVRLLVGALGERERVVVCGTGIDTDARAVLRELCPGSTLRKIPATLLDQYRSNRQLRLDIDAAGEPGQSAMTVAETASVS